MALFALFILFLVAEAMWMYCLGSLAYSTIKQAGKESKHGLPSIRGDGDGGNYCAKRSQNNTNESDHTLRSTQETLEFLKLGLISLVTMTGILGSAWFASVL